MAIDAFSQKPISITASSEAACRDRIRELYGEDYKIVRRQESIAKGFWPLSKEKQYTVWYVPIVPEPKKSTYGFSSAAQMDPNEERMKILEANQNVQSPQMKLILDEIKEIRSQLDEKSSMYHQDEHASIQKIESLLIRNDFTSEYIKKIADKIKKEFSLDDLDDFSLVQKTVVDWIGEAIEITDIAVTKRPEIIVLVGPTGIGKTTTIAKLAAYYSGIGNTTVPKGLNIRLITIDNVRVQAKEQLETYGVHMGIPVEYADSTNDLQGLLSLYGRDVDVILIDTAGHSPKDYENLAKLRTKLDLKGQKLKIFLAISAPTKANDLRTILQQYETFGYESVIVTKLDETSTVGTVLSVLDEKQKSVAYITDGQKVPRNFKKADEVSFLINLVDFAIDREHIDEKFIQEKIG